MRVVPSVEAALVNQQLAVRVSILCMRVSAQTWLKKMAEKEPKSKRHCSRQLTLHNFFKGKSSASSLPKPLSAKISPRDLGVHIYTTTEIENSKGLQKEFRIFWNEKALEICHSKKEIKDLKSSSAAIQGAIHVSWALHKTKLLEIKADKLRDNLRRVYQDEITLKQVLSTVDKNVERLKTAHAVVTATYESGSSVSTAELEHDLNEGMAELRRAQEALIKAIKRRSIDTQLFEQEMESLVVPPPIQLTQDEIGHLIQITKEENEE